MKLHQQAFVWEWETSTLQRLGKAQALRVYIYIYLCMGWYGMVWYGFGRYGTVRYDTYCIALCCVVLYGMVLYGRYVCIYNTYTHIHHTCTWPGGCFRSSLQVLWIRTYLDLGEHGGSGTLGTSTWRGREMFGYLVTYGDGSTPIIPIWLGTGSSLVRYFSAWIFCNQL